jgi:hypothetical protein
MLYLFRELEEKDIKQPSTILGDVKNVGVSKFSAFMLSELRNEV